jgi:hypothetical protein
MTKYEEEKLRGRRNRIKKTLRKKKMGLIPPTKDERLEAALKPLAEAGATREQLNEAVWASVNAFRQGVAISTVTYERILDRLTSPKSLPPMCEECDMEMERYYEASDTGRDGWACPGCGWSQDE